MRRNWIGTVILVGMSMVAGLFLSQVWEPVLGQSGGFSVETPPQVVVQQQAELPKCCVDFTDLPSPRGGPSPIRVITVVDTEAKKIAVYHMELSTGGLRWLSTRDIRPDLTIHQFNALSPLPSELNQEILRLGETKRVNQYRQ
jgi:hypothetical protein